MNGGILCISIYIYIYNLYVYVKNKLKMIVLTYNTHVRSFNMGANGDDSYCIKYFIRKVKIIYTYLILYRLHKMFM